MDQLTRTKLQKIGLSPPGGGMEADMWWNDTSHRVSVHDGTSIRQLSTLDDIANAVNSTSIDNIVVSSDPNTTIPDGTLLLVTAPDYNTYFTNFSDQAVGAPAGWTERWVTTTHWSIQASTDAGVTGGKVLSLTAGPGRRGISWDQIDADADRADVEICFKWRSSTGQSWMSAMARATGAAGAENGYIAGSLSSGGVMGWQNINVFHAGVSHENHFTQSPAFTANTWYISRFRLNGSDLKLRSWKWGTTEQTTWDLTLSPPDNDILTAGWVGLWAHAPSSEYKDFDWIGVATKGGTAPVGA